MFFLLFLFPSLFLAQLPPLYDFLPADSKLTVLWSLISADQTQAQWFTKAQMNELYSENVKLSFEMDGDILSEGRKKLIHTVGLVAKGEFIVDTPNPYSGIFKTGAKNTIVRLAVSKPPNYTKTKSEEAWDNLVPSLSLKFLRDGLVSANLVAKYGGNGSKSWNFFHKPLSNQALKSKGKIHDAINCKFSEASKYVQSIGLYKIAEYDEKGNRSENPSFPFKVLFEARPELKSQFPESFEKTYIEQIKGIPSGTILYDIFAIAHPHETKKKLIGTIKTKSEFITSKFGDEKLFFKHNYMEDDFKVHPEWEKDTPILNSLLECRNF
jgi:hypothetical protein